MSLFNIDQDKCERDGLCVECCPVRAIEMKDEDAFPTPAANAEEICINCGHCLAICPQGALSLKTMPVEQCSILDKNLIPGADQIRQLLQARRSIRSYQPEPVPHEQLADLIDLARYAPTGTNKQQVYWTVFENPAEVRQLSALVVDWARLLIEKIAGTPLAGLLERLTIAWDQGQDRILYRAPHLIVVHFPADMPFAQTDCIIALTYLEIYAAALGLGTCWAGFLTAAANTYPPLVQALGLPAGHQCAGAVMLGRPAHQYSRIPQRNAPQVAWR